MTTSAETRETIEFDTGFDLEQSPRCLMLQISVKFVKIFGIVWRRGLHEMRNPKECGNTAVWVGATRCCHQTVLVCTKCRVFMDRDGHVYCPQCKKNPKPPNWVRL